MPKIPMPEMVGPTAGISNLSPVSGGQIISSGSDRLLSSSISSLQSGFAGYASAVTAFKAQQEETENNLAAAEAQNLYNEINNNLIRRMAENPGAFGEFEKWSNEADALFRKQEGQFTDRMTPEFRKKYSLRMQANIIAHRKQRIMTGIQSKVTADYNLFQNLFKEAAEQNQQQALNLLEQHRGKLISEQEYQIKKEIDLPRTFQFADARRRIDAGESGIIEQLEAQDSKGNYVNFTAVSPEKHRSLLSYAKAKDSQARANENLAFLDMLNSGSPISKGTVEASFEGRTSPEDLRQKMEQLQMVDRFESARERAVTAANAKAESVREKKDKTDFENMLAQLVTMTPPSGEYERAEAKANLTRQICSRFAGNGSVIKRLLGEVEEVFKAADPKTAGQSYKNSATYIYAKRELAKKRGGFESRFPGRKNVWYLNTYDDSSEVENYNFKMAQVALDEWVKLHPTADEKQVDEFIARLKKQVNDAETDKLVGFWTRTLQEIRPAQTEKKEYFERKVNGRIAIFDKNKKFLRWKDGK